MNRITLLGRIGQDPEIKTVGETKVCRFSIATSEKYKNKAGEKVEDTTWHSVEAWGKQAEVIAQYCKKGDQLLVVGQQRHEKHDDKFYAKVRLSEFEFVGGKSAGSSDGGSAPQDDDEDGKLPF